MLDLKVFIIILRFCCKFLIIRMQSLPTVCGQPSIIAPVAAPMGQPSKLFKKLYLTTQC